MYSTTHIQYNIHMYSTTHIQYNIHIYNTTHIQYKCYLYLLLLLLIVLIYYVCYAIACFQEKLTTLNQLPFPLPLQSAETCYSTFHNQKANHSTFPGAGTCKATSSPRPCLHTVAVRALYLAI